MKTKPSRVPYSKYRFSDFSGYLVTPKDPISDQKVATIRHSASEQSWVDHDIHYHDESEEYYFLMQGELQLLVDDSVFSLRPYEILQVKPKVPHAILGGSGPIELFVFRALAPEDRQSNGSIPSVLLSVSSETERDLSSAWGCRVSLKEERHQNCWLFGFGKARFDSDFLCLAYMNHPTVESVNKSRASHRHRLHLHKESFEYYAVLKGSTVLQIEDEYVEVEEGEIVEVPPNVGRVKRSTSAPFKGFTLRVPGLADKVEL